MTAALRDQELLDRLVAPICAAHGVECVDVKFMRMKGGGVLKVIIDRAREDNRVGGSGVSVDDCKQVSRDLSTALDLQADTFPGKYHLEVSSPGLERPLVRLDDFSRFAGREAKIHTRMPVSERRNFTGELKGVDGDQVRIAVDGAEFAIPHAEITKAHLVHRFDGRQR